MDPAARARLLAGPDGDRWRSHFMERDRLASGEVPPRSAPAPTPTFVRDPARVNVGFLVPVQSLLGGAERVCHDIVTHLDPVRFAVPGVALYAAGPDVAGRLAAASDVVVTWGVPDWPDLLGSPRPAVVLTAHGDGHWAADSVRNAAQAEALVAVGPNCVAVFPEAERSRVRVIPNMVDPTRTRPTTPRAQVRAAWGVPAGATVALCLCRLSAEKRVGAALAAADPDRGLWVVVHGEGAQRPELEALCARTPGAVLAGHTEDVGSALAAADGLVLASETEGLSLATLEAMHAGVPVVGTPVGLLTYRPDLARMVPALAGGPAIRAAILADRADPALTAARVARAARYVREAHDAATFIRGWSEVIASVAPPPPPPGPGTILKGWLGYAGIKSGEGCRCNEVAAKMDANPADWSMEHLGEIVDAMEAEARRRGLPFVRWAAETMVRKAVRAAREGGHS